MKSHEIHHLLVVKKPPLKNNSPRRPSLSPGPVPPGHAEPLWDLPGIRKPQAFRGDHGDCRGPRLKLLVSCSLRCKLLLEIFGAGLTRCSPISEIYSLVVWHTTSWQSLIFSLWYSKDSYGKWMQMTYDSRWFSYDPWPFSIFPNCSFTRR